MDGSGWLNVAHLLDLNAVVTETVEEAVQLLAISYGHDEDGSSVTGRDRNIVESCCQEPSELAAGDDSIALSGRGFAFLSHKVPPSRCHAR
jgi:hypothetical protein